MNAERHYDDEALIALMEAKRDSLDPHLPGCVTCREKLESVRMIADVLADETVWNESPFEAPVPSTIASLRAFADRMIDEDLRGEVYVRTLLEGPHQSWRAMLDAHPEYRTAGVVRKLINASDQAIDTNPADAVEITTLATELAESLDRALFTTNERAYLCGSARREKAYALYYTGRFAEALAEADRADGVFARCTVSDYDRARLGIIRALALRALESWTKGLAAAGESVRVFEQFGDVERVVSARLAEVQILFSLGEFGKAQVILTDEEERLRSSEYAQTHARVLSNLAYAHLQQGHTAEALNYYEAASAIFSSLGVTTEALRMRWGVATLLAGAGRRAEALPRLRELAAEFGEIGMACEAALAGLDVAELLLSEEKFAEIEEICVRAIRSFELAGVSYTGMALTALGYIREASRNKTATPKLVRHVRDYIRRLPSEANLHFAPL